MSYTVLSHDELKARILQDYDGQTDRDGNIIDTGKGGIAYIDASVLASALQGILYRLKHTEQQTLPNLAGAKTASINGWASVLGVTRLETDTDADLVQKIIDKIQEPAAGGNENDWINWAKSVITLHQNSDETAWAETVEDAAAIENERRPGSVDLYVLTDWSSFPAWVAQTQYEAGDFVKHTSDGYTFRIFECQQSSINNEPDLSGNTAYWELLKGSTTEAAVAVEELIETEKRPLGIWDTYYDAVTIVPIDITATVTGEVDLDEAIAVLTNYLNESRPGQVISLAKIASLLVELGAITVDITEPADDYMTESGEKALAGAIDVSEE